jgi:3-methyladenine DNA glycosylase AlkD
MDAKTIRQELSKLASPENKKNYERYFKGVLKFIGLKGPQTKEVFKRLWPCIKQMSLEQQINLGIQLIKSKFSEEKSFGIRLLGKNAKLLEPSILSTIYDLFDTHVYDWATCDGISSKVIGEMLRKDNSVAKIIVKWKDSPKTWAKRSAAISFLKVARFGKHNKDIIKVCSTIVKDPARFVQLGNGWVLRELSLADLTLVVNFIKKNYNYFSREGLRYAIEKMKPGLKKELLNYKKKKKNLVNVS